ncbi:SDR family NAD(P)-dependent oxidoreductase [Variovorax sp. PCZ-1]|uniref:SDR family NAD(P)-dependent oxidoreductase n=1 Tax=Variovorax sp. PCZ-1 TaxID=2835533 RepID=UPI001BCE6FC4|nr:SDR family NAD(P)-dependent oxidoreductase [Variovorax sp. PCZ-1]MBS7808644.1 SDR family NAD(P)-dependent oxidoreductase [Variovorax sp. PCZ-1]
MSLNPKITDWHGKRAWLVGASTGIGRATAVALHMAGAKVIVSARSASPLQELTAQYPGLQTLQLDATDEAGVKAAANKLVAEGGLDLMMYCAGIYQPLRAQELKSSIMAQHMQVNYIGAAYVTEAVLPAMLRAKRGHLSYVSSVAGFRGLPKSLAYGPTKAAMINMAEALYIDLHDEGLGVSVINPGFVETPLTSQNTFRMPALIKPEQAAREIISGWEAGKFEMHFPKRFTAWLKLMRSAPHGLYFKMTRQFTGL